MQINSEDVVDWNLEDPAKEETDVNAVRNEILGKTMELIDELNRA
jgi:hypothetical protein